MTTPADPALLDTNVLVHAVFPAMPDHAASRALVDRAKGPVADLCVAPQNTEEPRRSSTGRATPSARRSVETHAWPCDTNC
jgi:predicted nucleic acid-binding protein